MICSEAVRQSRDTVAYIDNVKSYRRLNIYDVYAQQFCIYMVSAQSMHLKR